MANTPQLEPVVNDINAMVIKVRIGRDQALI
jgi:hypothetical protein